MDNDPLQSMKVPELKELAKDLGIEGADGMKRAELIEAIEQQTENENKENGGNAGSSHIGAGASSPTEANKHYSNHPKFDKFKKGTDQ